MAQTVRAPVAAFFDLDGTLLDTNYLHTWAWWRALNEFGHDVTMAQVHRLIGKDGDQLLTELTGRPDKRISHAHTRYFVGLADSVRRLPGAAELLQRVHQSGIRVVIVTSAEEEELHLLLAALDCDPVIEDVVHGGSVGVAKPAPDLYLTALSRTGVDGADAMALGDTGWDVAAARRAGLRCVCVESGGVAACELKAAGAVAVYETCQDLLDRFERSPLGAGTRPLRQLGT